MLVGLPELDVNLKGRLDLLSTATTSIRLTVDELARICLALSEGLLDVEGRDAVKLLKLTGNFTDLLDQAVVGTKQTGKTLRAAPKAGETTAKPKATKATGRVYQ